MSNNLRRRILRAESTIDSAIVTPDAINAARRLWRSTGQLPEGAKLREAVLRIENALVEAMRRIDALDDLPVDDAPLRSALRVQVANESLPPTVAEV